MSDDPYEIYFHEGFPEFQRTASALGYLCYRYGMMESDLSGLVTVLLQCSWDATRSIVDATGTSITTRCDLVLKLGRLDCPSGDWFLALEATVNHIKTNISPLRNRLIHDMWLGEDKQLDAPAFLKQPQSHQPKMLTPPAVPERTVASIWELCYDILWTSAELQELKGKHIIWKRQDSWRAFTRDFLRRIGRAIQQFPQMHAQTVLHRPSYLRRDFESISGRASGCFCRLWLRDIRAR